MRMPTNRNVVYNRRNGAHRSSVVRKARRVRRRMSECPWNALFESVAVVTVIVRRLIWSWQLGG
jgi:hypothetical protein